MHHKEVVDTKGVYYGCFSGHTRSLQLCLTIPIRFVGAIRGRMQLALEKVNELAPDRGLDVNPGKTEVVLFTRMYKLPPFRPQRLYKAVLELKEEARYLVLILDRKLSWKPDIIKPSVAL